jgi:hypothetical protein
MASPQTTPLSTRKEELNRETERYKQAIEDQVSILKEDAGKVTRKALVIGGAALGTYLVVRAIVNRKKKKRSNELTPPYTVARYQYAASNPPTRPSKSSSPVAGLITKQIALFLVAIAKNQIMKAIERNGKHDHPQTTAPVTVQ